MTFATIVAVDLPGSHNAYHQDILAEGVRSVRGAHEYAHSVAREQAPRGARFRVIDCTFVKED